MAARVWLILMIFTLASCDGSGPAPLRLLVASSAVDPARLLATRFEEETGISVEVIAASSGALVRQVENGLQGDVALLASPQWMDRLEQFSPTVQDSRRICFGNRLVIASGDRSPHQDPISLQGAAPAGRWVIGIPSSVPVGQHARASLEALGWWQDVQPRAVMAASSRAAFGHVVSGSVDLGFIWLSDAADRCQVLAEIPESISGPIAYPVAKLGDRGGAQLLFDRICASSLWHEAGFISPMNGETKR